jgi:hypothetical protein
LVGFIIAVLLERKSKLLIHAHSHEAAQLSLRANDRHGGGIIQCGRLLLLGSDEWAHSIVTL